MVLTIEEKKLRTDYKKYQTDLRDKYRTQKAIASALRKDIIRIVKNSPKDIKKNVLRKKLLAINKNILNLPKWTTTMLSFDEWNKRKTQQYLKELREQRARQKKFLEEKKKKSEAAKKKEKYGKQRREADRMLELDRKRLKRWGERFAFNAKFRVKDKAHTTMDEGLKYYCYLRWSDDYYLADSDDREAMRDRFIKVLPKIIKDARSRVNENRRVRLLWKYIPDLEHPEETKWASTKAYTGDWDALLPAVKEVTDENSNIYEGLYSTVVEVVFHIGEAFDFDDYGEAAARSIKTARKTFYEVSDKTHYNCQYHAVYRTGNDDWYSPCVVKPAFDLKNKIVKDSDIKTGGDLGTLKLLANYKQYNIKVYNNLYQLIHTIEPEVKTDAKRKRKIKIIEIRINNHHWTALFRYKDMKSPSPDIVIPTPADEDPTPEEIAEEQLDDDQIGNCELIKPKRSLFMPQKIDSKIATYDLETTKDANGRCVVYMAAICVPTMEIDTTDTDTAMKLLHNNHQVIEWVLGKDGCVSPIDDMLKEMLKYNGHTFYAHNGGKFDLNFILKETLPDGRYLIDGDTELNGRWLTLNIRDFNDRHQKITIRDSWCLLQNPLDMCTKKFKVKYQKLTETVHHDDITLNNYMSYYPELTKYLYHDVMGLLEVLFKFRNIVWEQTMKKIITYKTKITRKGGKSQRFKVLDEKGRPIKNISECGINITKCYTLASLAKKAYFRNFYNEKQYPIYTLSKQTDKYLRNSYAGGRVECHYMGEIAGKIYYYDFTSLFPAMMVNDLPYGKSKFVDGKDINIDKFFGFIRCKVKQIKKDIIPLHCVKLDTKGRVVQTNGKLTFPIIDDWTELTLFSEEIKLGMGMYEYEFLDGIQFEKGKCMEKYVRHLYKMKEDSSPKGIAPNPVLRQIAKIWVNSAYGYWGLKAFDREGCAIEHETSASWKMKYEKNKLISCGKIGDYYVSRFEEDIGIKELNVGIASAITAYARMRLWSLMKDIRAVGGKVYYNDTDSIMTDLCMTDYPELMKEYIPDGTGMELGSLKNEAEEEGLEYFDRLYIGGKKLYCLEYGNNQIKKSCKGFSFVINDDGLNIKTNDAEFDKEGNKVSNEVLEKLTFDHFKNEKIEGRQFTMVCGRSRFISETDNFNTYLTRYTKKITNKYHGKKYDNEFIQPLTI